jgi:tripeptide aminopeptidase
MMDFDRLIQRAIDIQSIPAPTFHEEARRAYMQNEFKQAGLLDIEVDSVGNLLGRVPGSSKPALIISAHLDSVFPEHTPLEIQHTDNRIVGPGIGDNAISLAVLLELAIDLTSTQLAADVWLVANVGEEGLGNLLGMKEIARRFGDEVSAYIVLEGMSLGQIYNAGLPVRRYRLTVKTEGGHAWNHAGRTSAIHELMAVGSQVTKLPLPQQIRTSLNIGQIDGGISVNSIASRASLVMDLRSEGEATLEKLEQEVMKCIKDHPWGEARYEVEQIGQRPGGKLAEGHPLLSIAIDAVRSVGECNVEIRSGSTDANVPLSMGFPAICLGLTYGGGAHSLQEYIELEPIVRGYQALVQLIQDVLELD